MTGTESPREIQTKSGYCRYLLTEYDGMGWSYRMIEWPYTEVWNLCAVELFAISLRPYNEHCKKDGTWLHEEH